MSHLSPNYLVMEDVEGEDLRGPLDFDDALLVVKRLIEGRYWLRNNQDRNNMRGVLGRRL